LAFFMQVRIDHRNGTVHFGGQQLESDRIRDHISALARRLTKALHMVEPDVSKEVEARRLKVSDIFPSSAAHHTGHANKPKSIICSFNEFTPAWYMVHVLSILHGVKLCSSNWPWTQALLCAAVACCGKLSFGLSVFCVCCHDMQKLTVVVVTLTAESCRASQPACEGSMWTFFTALSL